MKLEYTAQIVRGWPADGALERAELVKQGSLLVNGDLVEMQVDGTVDRVSATKSRKVGLVIRGNGDSPAAANANGTFMSPAPAKTISAIATWSAGKCVVTVTGHGYATGNIVVISGVTTAAVNGTYTITWVSADTFSITLADPGAITLGSPVATLSSTVNNSGKAVVLWGNYIVATSNFTAGAYVPGSPVTAASGKWALNTGTAASDVDAVAGFVLRVQGATATETSHLVIVAK
jgi:hypothetical protein